MERDDPREPTQLRAGLPRDLETVCLKCLQKQPAQRYATANALAEDLRRFLAGEPIQARPIGRFERVARWARRNPTRTTLLAATGLAALVLWLGAFWHSARMRERNAALGEALQRESRQADQLRRQSAALKDREHSLKQLVYAGTIRRALQFGDNRQYARALAELNQLRPDPGRDRLPWL